jgi:hypothetical protein
VWEMKKVNFIEKESKTVVATAWCSWEVELLK